MTIKGIAGPHVVEVRGFAPGTSAADVEEAMRAKGISVHSCRVLESSPKVIVDVLCDSKEDADRIGEFHQQWVRIRPLSPVVILKDRTFTLTKENIADRLRFEDRQRLPIVRHGSATSADPIRFQITAFAEQWRPCGWIDGI